MKMGKTRLGIPKIPLFAILTLAIVLSGPANAAGEICGEGGFDPVMSLAAIATVGTAAVIVLCYMFGEFFQNPRMLTWAKTEVFQVFISLALAGAVLGLAGTFCNLRIGDVAQVMTPNAAGPSAMPAVLRIARGLDCIQVVVAPSTARAGTSGGGPFPFLPPGEHHRCLPRASLSMCSLTAIHHPRIAGVRR